MDARLQNEGFDESRVVNASDVQLSLLFDNTSFGHQLKKCISKRGAAGGCCAQDFEVHNATSITSFPLQQLQSSSTHSNHETCVHSKVHIVDLPPWPKST